MKMILNDFIHHSVNDKMGLQCVSELPNGRVMAMRMIGMAKQRLHLIIIGVPGVPEEKSKLRMK